MAKASKSLTRSIKDISEEGERRREYQRRYYRAHKEKAQAYQIAYNRKHYVRKRKIHQPYHRPVRQLTFTQHNFMEAHDTKLVKMFEQVLSGERLFTM